MKRVVLNFLLLLGLLFAGPLARSQTPRADSLKHLLRAQPRVDTTRVRRLLALAQELSGSDAPQATTLAQQALVVARRLGAPWGEGQSLLTLSMLSRRQTHYEHARQYGQQALRFFKQRADNKGQGKAWLQLSTVDIMLGNPTPALNAALKGLPLAEQAGDLRTQMLLRVNMGNTYFQLEDYAEAVPLFRAALQSALRTGDLRVQLSALNGLANSFAALKKFPQALVYNRRAVQLSQQLGDVSGEIVGETNLADVFGLQGNRPAALAHGRRAWQLVQTTHDNYNLPSVELLLAREYLDAAQPDSARVLALHGLLLSQQTRSHDNIRNASDILAKTYAQSHDFAQAYRYRTLQLAYNDTLAGEDTQRRTSALRHRYELDKKQAQIVLLTRTRQLQAQKASRQRWQLYGVLVGLAGAVLVAVLLLRNIFLKKRATRRLQEKTNQIADHRDQLDRALTALQTTQDQLVQREKMASLGELTAGVAHEIQNPLNFVTNFSDLSVDLVAELEEHLTAGALSPDSQRVVQDLLQDLSLNQHKIQEHGHRADRIIKRMLEHSRTSSGSYQATDLNVLAHESLQLAYHGWRAKNPAENTELVTDFDPHLAPVAVVAQDLGRVLVNLFTNSFYAVTEKRHQVGPSYQPVVCVQTQYTADGVRITVRDNGNGIPTAVRAKVFQPFFTTKPTGDGTGLGLSLSYDIVTKGHGGTLSFESEEGQFAQFIISLPVRPEMQGVPDGTNNLAQAPTLQRQ